VQRRHPHEAALVLLREELRGGENTCVLEAFPQGCGLLLEGGRLAAEPAELELLLLLK